MTVEVWRGGVNTWECDEMGHMNVRFYVARAGEGLAGLARALDLPHAFAPGAPSTLLVREHHIRFLKEAKPGMALAMEGGVVAMGEDDARLLLLLRHQDGAPAASFLVRVTHATPDGRAFPWPARARAAAERLKVAIPAHAGPRSLDFGPVDARASIDAADALGLACISRGVLAPQECDVFGRMRAEQVIGRVADGVPALLAGVRRKVAETAAAPPARVGGAVLENRILYLDLPHAGDHVEIRSGLAGIDAKTQRIVHWMLDPVSGRPWAVAEAVAVNFDLDTRKTVPISDAAREALSHIVTEGLALD